MRNPDVTVRSRGVMEKCTYCVQRIRGAEIEAEREPTGRGPDGRPDPRRRDPDRLPAACPAGAIVFGDLNDPNSAGRAVEAEPTNYGLLAELNTMPRTTLPGRDPEPEPRPCRRGPDAWQRRELDPRHTHRPERQLPLEPEMHPLVRNKHDLVSVGDAIGDVVLGEAAPDGVVDRLPGRVRHARRCSAIAVT